MNEKTAKMDLFFTCLLRPTSPEKEIPLKIQPEEIAAAKWMDVSWSFPPSHPPHFSSFFLFFFLFFLISVNWQLDEFQELKLLPGIHERSHEVARAAVDKGYEGWRAEKVPIGFMKGDTYLYHAAGL